MKKFWFILTLTVGLILPIAHSPVNHLPAFTPAVAVADTGFIDPNADVGTQLWYVQPPGGTTVSPAYSALDDGIRTPDTPDTTDYIWRSGMNKIDTFDMTTLTITSASNVTVLAYGYDDEAAGNSLTAVSTTGGGWTTLTAFNFTGSATWKSVSFNGTWNQADLNALQVQVKTSTALNSRIYAIYAVVTYTGGGGGTPTGKVIMITDDGEGTPSYGYNYDFISVYPPEQSDTYVKATSSFAEIGGEGTAYLSTDPINPLTGYSGVGGLNGWYCDGAYAGVNQKFNIDLGSAEIVKRIYYENAHEIGEFTNAGAKNFTFYGSNTAGDFSDLTYTDTGDWVQLTISQSTLDEHISADQPDPKYITVTNTTAYRYYSFKFADNYGHASFVGVRRIELQEAR